MITEIPSGMQLTNMAHAILSELEKKGFAIWQGDSSPESYETVKQLVEISGNVGYRLIQLRTYAVHQVETGASASGKFLLLNENVEEVKFN